MILAYFVGGAILLLLYASFMQYKMRRRKWIKITGNIVDEEFVYSGDNSTRRPIIEFVFDGSSRKGIPGGAQMSEGFVFGSKINIIVNPEKPEIFVIDSISGFVVPLLLASFAIVMMYIITTGGK